MSTALLAVLGQMTASYDVVEPSAPATSKTNAKSAKVKAPQSATVKVASPSPHVVKASDVTTDPLPKAGTISAWQFLQVAASYNVSWTDSVTPTRHTTPKLGTSREAMINAIAGYCGWNPALDFGTQDKNARRQAQSEVNPALGIIEVKAKPSLTVAGLMAGMPDHRAKRYNSLMAREKWTVDAIVQFDNVSNVEQFRKACTACFDSAALAHILPIIDRLPLSDAAKQADDYRKDLAMIRKELVAEFAQ